MIKRQRKTERQAADNVLTDIKQFHRILNPSIIKVRYATELSPAAVAVAVGCDPAAREGGVAGCWRHDGPKLAKR